MKQLVEFIAKSLVDEPDEVVVNEVEGERTTIVQLSVAKADLGKVIGKEGRTARAIRAVLAAAATRDRKKAVLEILE